LALGIRTPLQRKLIGRDGWRKSDLIAFIRYRVAPALVYLGIDNVTVVHDKGLKITSAEIRDAIKAGGVGVNCTGYVLSTAIAKHVSPLDNALFALYKHRIKRKDLSSVPKVVRACRDVWNAFTAKELYNQYHKSAITKRSDPTRGTSNEEE
jgi:hypothetical protein